MLELKQIESFYPENLRSFKRNLLREYLQYKILEVIFSSGFADKLSFMGGTAIHTGYGLPRFSEDIDFDNLGLDKAGFEALAKLIQRKLSLEGCRVEIKNSFHETFRTYVRIAGILYENGLTGHKEEKILIQVDAEPQNFKYEPNKIILNKFDVFTRINIVPVDILLAQKIYAIFMRKRPMGRDFYDAIFLLGKTKPNFNYLSIKMQIKDASTLKKRLLAKCKTLNFTELAKDLGQFLFMPSDAKKILLFEEYVKGLSS